MQPSARVRLCRWVPGGGTVASATGTTATYSGAVSGSTAFNVGIAGSAGTVILSGTNTYTAATTINAGILQAGSTTALSASSSFTVASGATLNLGGIHQRHRFTGRQRHGDQHDRCGDPDDRSNGSSTLFSGTLQNVGGNLALTKTGAGTLTLSGSSTYSGATTVSAGTLQAASTTAFTHAPITRLPGSWTWADFRTPSAHWPVVAP